ncbi:cell differentiation protein rcd1 [Endogone sp. FLAS-F59071]|nr:cell differentiation protein rcd1 [Endogone sp. FLAS-F59071]|eukprot:RUS19521.1 cell differentiation protein rcd1 [Endogone sp. FLAS-F59071]
MAARTAAAEAVTSVRAVYFVYLYNYLTAAAVTPPLTLTLHLPSRNPNSALAHQQSPQPSISNSHSIAPSNSPPSPHSRPSIVLMHSLGQHHPANNPQLQQYLQNPLLPSNGASLASQLQHASNMHPLPPAAARSDPYAYAAALMAAQQNQLPMPMQAVHQQQLQQQQAQQQQAAAEQQQQQQQKAAMAHLDEEKIYALVLELTNPQNKEQALLELSKKRELYEDLALVLWHSFGVMAVLLQEIVSVYPLLSPPALTGHASNRVCNALALLQCVASHNETRGLFLSAHIPLFLYPFLNTVSKTRPFEYLRLTSLGVIGALVKNDNSEVINFLLSTEIIPLCLRIMETGSELSKTVAIFIVQKILLDDTGLAYICQTYERFYAVATVLNNMVNQLVDTQAVRLLKHVVRCYLRLSDNPRAREALRQCLPEPLRDATFSQVLKDDITTKRCLAQLLVNLSDNVVTSN